MATQLLQRIERPAPHEGPAVRRTRGRIEGLDGLRAIAIAAVLVYHLRPESLPGGYLGVDVFLVVSGFLITTLLLREVATHGRIDLPSFWLRRARRLLPALVSVVVVTIPLAWLASTDLLVGIGRQALGALTFSSNWLEIGAGTSYFAATAPQLYVNFWSLAVEEQFYLLWPVTLVAILALTRHRARTALVLAGVSAVLMAALHTPGEDATRVYYGTDTHLFGLMIGAALAFTWARRGGGVLATEAWRRWRVPATGVALVGLVALMATLRQTSPLTFRGGILLASLLTAVLVAALLTPGPFQRVMRLRPLEWLGQRSYGIYLWHWPVILILTELVPTAHDSPAHWAVRGTALTLTLLVAAASFRYLEQPVRELGFRESWRRLAASASAAAPAPRRLARTALATTAVLAATATVAVSVAPERSTTQAVIEQAQTEVDVSAAAAEAVELAPAADYSMPTGEEITGFGDSIVVTSKDGLAYRFPGIMLDARSNRQWPDGEAAVTRRLAEGTVRRAVFLDFGTNAGVPDPAVVRRVLDELGPDRMVVVINLYGGSHWVPDANATLAGIVADYPNAVVADWHAAISEQPALLQADRIHPGIEGAHLFADVVADAFADLSEQLTGEPVVEERDASGAADGGA